MSNRRSNPTIWYRLRRGLASILSLALLLGLLPTGVLPALADDQSWAMPYMQTLVDWGVMRGDVSGGLAPDRAITRAEFVAMMNRAYGYTRLAGHPFTDVPSSAWYAQDVDIAYNMGYFKGTSPTKASPNSSLTREQAAVLLARNMMLQPTVGETLGFSDTRALSEWSRGLVGAAASNGVINGYDDGSFRPQSDITRGEVAAMLVRAIGTPINTKGNHVLGNVYGNVTVNTAGVSLRDGTIAGNLYLTGGIDLGDVLLENVNVLGEIIVSGAGESNSSQSSVILRNVTADAMTVDSISQQFVTIRAEGNTDIPTTTVRTNAYVDDSTLPGYGLSFIQLDGEPGTKLQLAGNIKEVLDLTPKSDLQVVQGSVDKITIDEYAKDSTVLIEGGTRVDELDLDVGTKVEGEGDIKDLNVGSDGSTVEMLPDNITIRPGVSADINGSTMNSSQAAESSADPRLEAGYPKVKNVAPNSADLVFSTNKAGTVYWAVSAVSDGSVSEEDLITPPSYGGNIVKSGTVTAEKSKTEYTASLTGLTQDGSYYVTAILVDGRGNRSPVKVTAFTTPDGTVPAFNSGYPVITMNTTKNVQVTGMTNKSCQLYYALLPAGSTAPTPQEFKANAIRGNLGYGVVDAVKNVTQAINVNSTPLTELTRYTIYLWLTDYDGAKSSQVYSLNFTTPDEQPPVIVTRDQTNSDATGIELTFTLNESATLFWAIVPEGSEYESVFEGSTVGENGNYDPNEVPDPTDRKLQIKIEAGGGNSIKNGRKPVATGFTETQVTMAETRPLDTKQTNTSSYKMYLVAKDAAGNYSKVEKITVRTKDTEPPTLLRQEFSAYNEDNKEQPLVDTDISLVFSEGVRGGTSGVSFLTLYNNVRTAKDPIAQVNAKNILARALHDHIKLYYGVVGDSRNEVEYCDSCQVVNDQIVYGDGTDEWVINYCNAVVEMKNGTMVLTFPTNKTDRDKNALRLNSGSTYHFLLNGIRDNAEQANLIDPDPTEPPAFTVAFAKVLLSIGDEQMVGPANPGSDNDPSRIDYHFKAQPQGTDRVAENMYWDMLIWTDATITFTLYSRDIDADGNPLPGAVWVKEGQTNIPVDPRDGFTFHSLAKYFPTLQQTPTYQRLKDMTPKEYAIHVDKLEDSEDYTAWNQTVSVRVSIVAGTQDQLRRMLSTQSLSDAYDEALKQGVASIGSPDPFIIPYPFTDSKPPKIEGVPSISVEDTSAEISLMLDRPGRVYYLVFPLNNLYMGNVHLDNTTRELYEYLVSTVTSYNPTLGVTAQSMSPPSTGITPGMQSPPLAHVPLMIGDPDRDGLSDTDDRTKTLYVSQPEQTSFTNTRVFPGVHKQSTDEVPAYTTLTIPLNEAAGYALTPNTVYFVCLLTRGVSAVYAEFAQCYRFTTDQAARPLLNLSANSTVINAESDRSATMNFFLAVSGREGDPFKVPFTSNGTETGIAKPDWGVNSNQYTYTLPTGVDENNVTVLDAMASPCYDGGRYIGSVFDIFANDKTKNDYASLIRGQSVDGNSIKWVSSRGIVDTTGVTTIPTSNQFDCAPYMSPDDPGGRYTFVAVARGGRGSGDSFRAYYPVTIQDNTPPKIVNAYFGDLGGTPGSATQSTTLTLEFSEPLYFRLENDMSNEYYPIDNCGLGAHQTVGDPYPDLDPDNEVKRYYSIAGTVSSRGQVLTVQGANDHNEGVKSAPIRSITLLISNLTTTESTISFNNKGTIVDWAGNRNSRPLSISVKMVNTADMTIPNAQPYYEPQITFIAQEWDDRLG